MVTQEPLCWIKFDTVPVYAIIEQISIIKEHLSETQSQEKSLIWGRIGHSNPRANSECDFIFKVLYSPPLSFTP